MQILALVLLQGKLHLKLFNKDHDEVARRSMRTFHNSGVFGLHILPFFDKFVARSPMRTVRDQIQVSKRSPPSSMRFNDFSSLEHGLEQLLMDLHDDGEFSGI